MQGAEVASAASPGQEATIALGVRAEPGAADDLGPAGSANAGNSGPLEAVDLEAEPLILRSEPAVTAKN